MVLAMAWVMAVGYYKSRRDHDDEVIYFVKKFPTFRMEFENPFANEGDPPPVDDLSPEVRQALRDYCKYRFGILRSDTKSLEECKSRAIHEP